ncbi:MAG: signal recognition particle protein [Deltaproteobacteria bacterium]|nr:signal recognition particle protein [Deltaproteobacteria bacterium]MBI3296266.1 signal recognition particle protein [Deltaproteobacteria bacterium]
MFDSLTEKLLGALRSFNGKSRISEEILDETCRQLRTSLLEADVHVRVVKDFVDAVRSKAAQQNIQKSLDAERQLIRIIYHELAHIMGGKATALNFRVRPPAVFVVVGLQGSGKTTSLIKLAQYIRAREKKSILVASLDVYRPAAIEQLKILADGVNIKTFDNTSVTSVRDRAILAKEEAIKGLYDCLLVDTAGRLHIDDNLMDELGELNTLFDPAETLLVVDSMTGQDAVTVATTFQERVPLTGVILTKLDGDTRGGAALSVKAVTGCPIKFVGTGEKPEDFEVFHPDRFASRILDMGDILSLAEKAQSTIEPEEAERLAKKVKKNAFSLGDFYNHLQQIKKMGSFENLIKFLPGMGQVSKQLQGMAPPDTELKKIEAIILSMTPSERTDHNILDGSRRRRIAAGSGTKVEDVNRLMKQFLEARKMMTRLTKSPMGKRRALW